MTRPYHLASSAASAFFVLFLGLGIVTENRAFSEVTPAPPPPNICSDCKACTKNCESSEDCVAATDPKKCEGNCVCTLSNTDCNCK